MKKEILCFSSEYMLQGSFFMKMKKAAVFRYFVQTEQVFKSGGQPAKEVRCYFVPDIKNGQQTGILCRILLCLKKKQFIRRFQKEQAGGTVYDMSDPSDYPPDVRRICAAEFLLGISYQKNTVLGIIDGDALDYKFWVKLIRERLEQINTLLIVSDRPESFTELLRDAWEQQGLIVTITENEKELQFCDHIMDCGKEMQTGKYIFRKPCCYFMLYESRRKKRKLNKQNRQMKFVCCMDYAQKI